MRERNSHDSPLLLQGTNFVPHNEWGFAQDRFGQRPVQGRCTHSALRLNGSGRGPPTMWAPAAGHFGLGSVLIGTSAAIATLRSSDGIGELSRSRWTAACAGSGWGLRRLRPPPMATVPRRLEVCATVRGREALPHGHSVADCLLLRPSRRLPKPGRHDGIGRGARAHSLYSFKKSRYSVLAIRYGSVSDRPLTRPYRHPWGSPVSPVAEHTGAAARP
jgi:hypothetical protein